MKYFPSKAPNRLFYGWGGGILSNFNPANYSSNFTYKVLNAKSDSGFKKEFGNSSFNGYSPIYFDKPINFKYLGSGLLILGSDNSFPDGYGIDYQPEEMISFDTVKQCANDYNILNNSRINVLREKNIVNDSIEILHSEATEYLENSQTARNAQKTQEAVANETFASALGYRTYIPLRAMTNDLIQAVIVLLILSIPFAFFLERLIFGFTSIYKQVGAFAGIFILTFVILYIFHPAFSLAEAPIVIFLAFVIVLMNGLVIYIVMSKFKLELKALQGLASTVHGSQSDSNTTLASVLIGISGMRNRPLKTFLTATTVILLTFTILVFFIILIESRCHRILSGQRRRP